MYYTKVIAKNRSGKTITSDYFSFITAKDSSNLDILPDTLMVSSENAFVYNNLINKNDQLNHTIVFPSGTEYSFQFALGTTEPLKKITAELKNKYVLGESTTTQTQ